MARESTLNVSLTARLRSYVDAKVRSGRYESASEVIRDSLRALQERERIAGEFWAGVREKVAVARRQVAEGMTVRRRSGDERNPGRAARCKRPRSQASESGN